MYNYKTEEGLPDHSGHTTLRSTGSYARTQAINSMVTRTGYQTQSARLWYRLVTERMEKRPPDHAGLLSEEEDLKMHRKLFKGVDYVLMADIPC